MIYGFCNSKNKRKEGEKKKARKHEGSPLKWAEFGEKLGLWSPSPEPYLSCSLLLSDNPALLPSTGMQQQLPGLQTSVHCPREGTTCCGTGSSPGCNRSWYYTEQWLSLLCNFLQNFRTGQFYTGFKVGSLRIFFHWDCWSKKQKRRLCLFHLDRIASLLQGALALEGWALSPSVLHRTTTGSCISTCKT